MKKTIFIIVVLIIGVNVLKDFFFGRNYIQGIYRFDLIENRFSIEEPHSLSEVDEILPNSKTITTYPYIGLSIELKFDSTYIIQGESYCCNIKAYNSKNVLTQDTTIEDCSFKEKGKYIYSDSLKLLSLYPERSSNFKKTHTMDSVVMVVHKDEDNTYKTLVIGKIGVEKINGKTIGNIEMIKLKKIKE